MDTTIIGSGSNSVTQISSSVTNSTTQSVQKNAIATNSVSINISQGGTTITGNTNVNSPSQNAATSVAISAQNVANTTADPATSSSTFSSSSDPGTVNITGSGPGSTTVLSNTVNNVTTTSITKTAVSGTNLNYAITNQGSSISGNTSVTGGGGGGGVNINVSVSNVLNSTSNSSSPQPTPTPTPVTAPVPVVGGGSIGTTGAITEASMPFSIVPFGKGGDFSPTGSIVLASIPLTGKGGDTFFPAGGAAAFPQSFLLLVLTFVVLFGYTPFRQKIRQFLASFNYWKGAKNEN